MSNLKLANNAISRLSAGISDVATTLSVMPGDGAKYPALTAGQFFPATLQRASDGAIEIVKVTARATDVLTIVRAQEGTAALTLLASDRVEVRLTASTFTDEIARVDSTAASNQTAALAASGAASTAAAAAQSTADAALPKSGGALTGLLKFKSGSPIASAATVDLTGASGNTVHITGTVAVTKWTLTNGQVMDVIFDGALTLTHHATDNNLPSAGNITTATGDRAKYYYDGTAVWCLSYTRANGKPVIEYTLPTQTGNAGKSLVTNGTAESWGYPDQLSTASGSAPSFAARAFVNFNGSGTIRKSGNVSSVAKNGTGDYIINFTNAMPSANYTAIPFSVSTSAVSVLQSRVMFALPTTTQYRYSVFNTAGSAIDVEYNNIAFFE